MDLRSPCPPERELRGISLCAGYAGLDLGLHIAEPSYRTVAYVEREAHAAATLVARMEDEALGQAPIWDDLRTFDGRAWRGRIHIVSAGYPCQPFSAAGKRRGADDPRHLWPQVARIADEIRPEWLFCENVEGHLDLGFADVVGDLRAMGYSPKAGLFTAREAGASHRRRRLFILAHADGVGCGLLSGPGDPAGIDPASEADRHIGEQLRPVRDQQCVAGVDDVLADPDGDRRRSGDGDLPLFAPAPDQFQVWAGLLARRPDLQPAILRASDGMADRVERTRAAGNGVCSLAAAIAWRTLKAAHLGRPTDAHAFQIIDR